MYLNYLWIIYNKQKLVKKIFKQEKKGISSNRIIIRKLQNEIKF